MIIVRSSPLQLARLLVQGADIDFHAVTAKVVVVTMSLSIFMMY